MILTIQKDGSPTSFETDIRAAGKLLRLIWTTRGRVPNAMELDLLDRMTGEKPTITASEASSHISLWSSAKILSFFTEVSDILEQRQKKHVDAVKKESRSAINGSWILQLDSVLQDKVARDSRKRRKYSGDSLVDLLRFVRNLASHFYPLAPEVRAALGAKANLGMFWVSTFPQLLPHLYQAMQGFKGDERIKRFYPN